MITYVEVHPMKNLTECRYNYLTVCALVVGVVQRVSPPSEIYLLVYS